MFSLLVKAAESMSVDRLAQKAASPEAFGGGVSTAFSQKHVVEKYFHKYGSTERKFVYHPNPGFYIGYVKVRDTREFLSVVIMQKDSSVMASFWPDIEYGQDILGLMGKKAFADQVADSFIQNARG